MIDKKRTVEHPEKIHFLTVAAEMWMLKLTTSEAGAIWEEHKDENGSVRDHAASSRFLASRWNNSEIPSAPDLLRRPELCCPCA
jgi:hypothetical protein